MPEEYDSSNGGYMRAQFEQIVKSLCDLQPVPEMVRKVQVTVENMDAKVEAHDITLYGEKKEPGLVSAMIVLDVRIKDVQKRIDQIMAVGGLVGSAMLLWIIGQLLGLIKP